MTLTNIDKEKELMEGLSPSEHSALIGHATSRSLVVPLASVLLWGGLALYSNRNLAVKSPNKTKHLLVRNPYHPLLCHSINHALALHCIGKHASSGHCCARG